MNIARYQNCVYNLFQSGTLESILSDKEKQIVLEIGSGYDGLAHGIQTILNEQATYICMDLPELLLFQGAFLKVNNPEKSIYIYNSATLSAEFVSNELQNYDFILIPNYALKKLQPLKEIALAINMQSFQEMTEQQVTEYLRFTSDRVTRYLYSENVDRARGNKELRSVSAILQQYFTLYPSPEWYERIHKGTHKNWGAYYKKYFGTPIGRQHNLPKNFNFLF